MCPGVVASHLTETSIENRPSAFGAQSAPWLDPNGENGTDALAHVAHMMPAEDVGPIVIRAIRANRFHVLTHPRAQSLVERRFRTLLDDFEFAGAG